MAVHCSRECYNKDVESENQDQERPRWETSGQSGTALLTHE